MWTLTRNFLIVISIFASVISCGKNNIKSTDEHIYKGKLYITSGDTSAKTLFYMKTTADTMNMSVYTQFGETLCDIFFAIKNNEISVRSSMGDLDTEGLKRAAMLLLPILKESVFSKPIETEEGTVTFSNYDAKGFARTWMIYTQSLTVKVIFNDY